MLEEGLNDLIYKSRKSVNDTSVKILHNLLTNLLSQQQKAVITSVM